MSSVALAIFQVLGSHMWLVVTLLESVENISIIAESFIGQKKHNVNHRYNFLIYRTYILKV